MIYRKKNSITGIKLIALLISIISVAFIQIAYGNSFSITIKNNTNYHVQVYTAADDTAINPNAFSLHANTEKDLNLTFTTLQCEPVPKNLLTTFVFSDPAGPGNMPGRKLGTCQKGKIIQIYVTCKDKDTKTVFTNLYPAKKYPCTLSDNVTVSVNVDKNALITLEED